MKLFACPRCGARIYFENAACVFCGQAVVYAPDEAAFLRAESVAPCANAAPAGCNWAAGPDGFCRACRLNRTIPDLSRPGNAARWAQVEAAKRHLVFQLLSFRLPVEPKRSPDDRAGLAFDVLEDPPDPNAPRVLTGHDHGLVTLNLEEADPAARERMREDMGEPYRTLLGHFRHEVGHFYWERLVEPDPARLSAFRALFGDERADYGQALARHYSGGPPADWQERHVSVYAASHPWEDWAETWAHGLHILDLMEMAEALSLDPERLDTVAVRLARAEASRAQDGAAFETFMRRWLSLREAANALNRCMGLPDLYPFVIAPQTADKLRFVRDVLLEAGARA